ncbi:MAG: anthranilate phosphoribosyltransferase [Anaerolineales bacterium]|nr:anthranilate phosphoribosyltransferase [Anaerolineales bacterium]
MLKPMIAKILQNQGLTEEEAFLAMETIMTGQSTQAQIGGYLVGLRMKGETMEEIAGSARAMRSVGVQIHPSVDGPLLDIVGTGGDGAHSINISTIAAFVIAGAGYPVAKHGNRAASSMCGSADVLESLGLSLQLTPAQVQECIEQVGIGFMFAPVFHPAMKHAIGPRRELAQRTIFNLLGPLTNPANASHQLIGVYDSSLTEMMAEALQLLGVRSGLVVHSENGLDELTTLGSNRVSHLNNGKVTTYELNAADLGLNKATTEDLQGGSPKENAGIFRNILDGKDQSPRKDVILLNAAAALANVTGSIEEGLVKARESLESGAALEKLNALVTQSQSYQAAV